MTLSELMVSAMLTVSVSGALFSMVDPVRGVVQAQPEAADVQQRIRVAVDSLATAIREARTVVPRRVGAVAPDPPGSFREGTIAAITTAGADTYYLERTVTGGFLRHYDGAETDLPLVDHVVGLTCEFFGFADGLPPFALEPAAAASGDIPVVRVRIHLRVQAAAISLRGPAGLLFAVSGTSTSSQRFVPDQKVVADVTLRSR